jgi:hypothetical protein
MEIILRPLAMVALLLIACGISKALHRFIPNGRIKQILYKKHSVIPTEKIIRH